MVIELNSNATIATVEALLEALSYSHAGGSTFTLGERTLSISFNDGSSASNTWTGNVTIDCIDKPTVSFAQRSADFQSGDAPLVLDSSVELLDNDPSEYTSLTVETDPCLPQDQLSAPGHDASISSSFSSCVLGLTGTAISWQDAQDALEAVTYSNTASTFTSGIRTLTYTVTDTLGESSTNAYTLNVNTPPSLTVSPTLRYTEANTTALDSGLLLTEADADEVKAASVILSSGQESPDVIGYNVGSTGITAVLSGAELTFTGPASASSFQAVLRSVTFTSSSTPETDSRTVRWSVEDVSGGITSASTAVTIDLINDAVALTVSDSAFSEGDSSSVFLGSSLQLTDVEDSISSAMVDLSTGFSDTHDILDFAGTLPTGVAVDTSTPGVLSFSGTASVATYADLLQRVR